MIKIYGIKNCDTMKKAFTWLDERSIAYDFHDYKKHGANAQIIRRAIDAHGWENVINRRGTTWRNLPDDLKNTMDAAKAVKTALENPSIIKRPLIVVQNKTVLGFNGEQYEELFSDL